MPDATPPTGPPPAAGPPALPKVTYWLIPAADDAAWLGPLIGALADRYAGPRFAPHVTLYAGPRVPADRPNHLLRGATEGVAPLSLRVRRIGHSPVFTKTLFIEFEGSDTLANVSARLRREAAGPSAYVFDPHLSLLYKLLEDGEREALLSSVRLPRAEVRFDRVAAVAVPAATRAAEDVEAWRQLAALELDR